MKRLLILLFALAALPAAAQEPLYIVNGERMSAGEAERIAPRDIERMDRLPADDAAVERYGIEASNGVIVITLRYDTPARFTAGGELSFSEYIASRVHWPEEEVAARVVLRYTVGTDGHATVERILESTDSRLRRRVLKALEGAPAWQPAMKNGIAIEHEGVLRVQLPKGKPMPRLVELVIR